MPFRDWKSLPYKHGYTSAYSSSVCTVLIYCVSLLHLLPPVYCTDLLAAHEGCCTAEWFQFDLSGSYGTIQADLKP